MDLDQPPQPHLPNHPTTVTRAAAEGGGTRLARPRRHNGRMATIAPYGTWESPISAGDTVAGLVRFADLAWDGDNVYWVELRQAEGGRQVLVRMEPDGTITDLTPAPYNVRTRVHEYGGGSFAVGHGHLAFSNFADQRLYRITGKTIEPWTDEPDAPGAVRYADGRFLADGSLICVRESHADSVVTNEVVRVRPDGEVTVIASGRDFYAAPRPSPDGSRVAWLEWDHPNMPWDDTQLIVAALDEGEALRVAGGGINGVAGGDEESVLQPEWRSDDELFFCSDRRGWWNLYRWDSAGIEPVVEIDAEIGGPTWVFGDSFYGFLSGGRTLIAYWENTVNRLAVVSPDGEVTQVPDQLSFHGYLTTDREGSAWFIGAGPTDLPTIYRLDVDTGEQTTLAANQSPVPEDHVPQPQVITFPTGSGAQAHGIYYPPTNPAYEAPEGELPPLIVQVHGGPTSHAYPRLAATFAYWTSRGFAVVDVNYRGSTGYGREFRNLLRGNWGIVDVEDSRAAASYLADQRLADRNRLVITGGSAGGYTTLACLAFGDEFRAGASHFGVADIELLAAHTHKFESRYLEGLVGTDPEEMRRRSPLYSADQISVPVALFQGLEDKVVPPEQAEQIAAALSRSGIPHLHETYEGEDHGFRQAENIIHALETELAFYGRVFGFQPADDLPPVELL